MCCLAYAAVSVQKMRATGGVCAVRAQGTLPINHPVFLVHHMCTLVGGRYPNCRLAVTQTVGGRGPAVAMWARAWAVNREKRTRNTLMAWIIHLRYGNAAHHWAMETEAGGSAPERPQLNAYADLMA